MNKQIAFIGCGNMGEAILKGLLQKKVFKRSQINVSDIRASRRGYIKKAYRVKTHLSNIKAVKTCDIVLLAVKPQDIEGVLKQLKPGLKQKLIITIAAGVSTDYIRRKTGAKRIVRVMSNIPVLAGAGMSVISSADTAGASDIRSSNKIFGSFGKVVFLNEKYMDAVTAVSGSGPAYCFLLMETMIEAAISLGINKRIAERIVSQTVFGACILQNYTDLPPSTLRRKVTSKGGTTEAAIKVFKKHKFKDTVKQAIKAASKRARVLSK